MKTTNPTQRNSSASLRVLCYLALTFGLASAGCTLRTFSRLETKALRYGTVSVGAARVTDYDNCQLKEARRQLGMALMNLRGELGGGGPMHMYPRNLDRAAGASSPSSGTSAGSGEPLDAIRGQTPRPSEAELVGMRMAALKLVQSELENLKLDSMSEVRDDFRRVVVSLDCSAWVRGKAAAALVYVDLYPFNADSWCHEAAEIMEEWWEDVEEARKQGACLCPKKQQCHRARWAKRLDERLSGKKSGYVFKSLDESVRGMPEEWEVDDKKDPEDWVAFCHLWLEKRGLRPYIAHVERTGRAEYLISAEGDHMTSGFEIGLAHPAGAKGAYSMESGRKTGRQMSTVRPLSLAFVAGDRRAGWLFMPSQAGRGRMLPTERRLKIVVDVPEKLRRLSIHVHKLFLDSDLGLLGGATLSGQMWNLEKTRDVLSDAEGLYEKKMPQHYRLIKTRMRNLLHQGWAEEIIVDIPEKPRRGLGMLIYDWLSRHVWRGGCGVFEMPCAMPDWLEGEYGKVTRK